MEKIREFEQGKNDDKKLFSLVGSMALDPSVHDLLGNAVSSLPGDIWHVAEDGNETSGFAQSRMLKSSKAHIRYLFSPKAQVRLALARAAVAAAKDRKASEVFTNDPADSKVWPELGFEKGTKRKGSRFVRWHKELK